MGSFTRTGTGLGGFVPPVPGFPPEAREAGYMRWFGTFLRDELLPYPGRVSIVARMVISATLTALAIMTFRIPGAAIAAYYTLLLARESPATTFRGAVTVMGAYLVAGVYSLVSVWLFMDYPLTHFLWVVVSLFLCFFLIKVMTSATASGAVAFTITIVIPLWDSPLLPGNLLTGTLWAIGSVAVGLAITVLVEYIFSALVRTNELRSGLDERLLAVSSLLRAEADEDADRETARKHMEEFAMLGVSRLRRLTVTASTAGNLPRNSTTVSLVGRLVDIAATLPVLGNRLATLDRDELRVLAEQITTLRHELKTGNRAAPDDVVPQPAAPRVHPIVVELHQTVRLLALSLSQPDAEPSPSEQAASPVRALFVSDAFTSSEHLAYALRGCLAATLCYLLINAVAWHGISTALATCVITALSSIGSSRQKQVLRLAGALVGGLIFGIGSQVFILPRLDSIGGFLVLFAAVTAFAAWFATASPRLSYFGLQVALAFYLIHLQEFYPQTNLAIGRDRVAGIALGLAAMWLVYETLGSQPAMQVMLDLFATNLRLLAELARPWKEGQAPELMHVRALRDRIHSNFVAVNAQADAVLFETGRQRHEHLILRERLLALQPQLRSLYLILVALLQYRLRTDSAEVSQAVRAAQESFDEAVDAQLRRMASTFRPDGMEPSEAAGGLEEIDGIERMQEAERRLEEAIRSQGQARRAEEESILILNRSLTEILCQPIHTQ